MNERKTKVSDVDKEIRSRRNSKGGRNRELLITGKLKTQGEVDINGLLKEIESQKSKQAKNRRRKSA